MDWTALMKVLLFVGFFLISLLVCYLCGSLIAASLDLSDWSEKGRITTVVFAFIFAVALTMGYFDTLRAEERKTRVEWIDE